MRTGWEMSHFLSRNPVSFSYQNAIKLFEDITTYSVHITHIIIDDVNFHKITNIFTLSFMWFNNSNKKFLPSLSLWNNSNFKKALAIKIVLEIKQQHSSKHNPVHYMSPVHYMNPVH